MSPERTPEVQPSQLAGTWYPGDPGKLAETVDRFLAEAKTGPDERLRAAIVPHAGHAYSGRAAASVYARLPAGRFRRALVLAPSHFHCFEGGAVFPGRGLDTPLGTVEVDREAARRLASCPGFRLAEKPYLREHSVEIQLPFLQRVDPDLCVVPVLVSGEGSGLAQLVVGLEELQDDETVVVVSSDFTHYGASFDYLPFPPAGPEQVTERLRELDFGAIDPVCRLDAEGFDEYVRETGITICGRAPISAFLRARADLRGAVVSYYTSLDVTGDCEHTVSYAGIAFTPASA